MKEYMNGEVLALECFSERYFVKSLRAENNEIVVIVEEADGMPVMNWIGEESVSFF